MNLPPTELTEICKVNFKGNLKAMKIHLIERLLIARKENNQRLIGLLVEDIATLRQILG